MKQFSLFLLTALFATHSYASTERKFDGQHILGHLKLDLDQDRKLDLIVVKNLLDLKRPKILTRALEITLSRSGRTLTTYNLLREVTPFDEDNSCGIRGSGVFDEKGNELYIEDDTPIRLEALTISSFRIIEGSTDDAGCAYYRQISIDVGFRKGQLMLDAFEDASGTYGMGESRRHDKLTYDFLKRKVSDVSYDTLIGERKLARSCQVAIGKFDETGIPACANAPKAD